MTDFAWELEDGSGVWQLEDGTGNWLLETQTTHGIEISGTQSQELIQRKITKFIPVEFVFNLCAGLITNVGVRIPAFGQKLLPMGLFSEKLRRSFVIPTASLKAKLKEYLLNEIKVIKFQEFCDKYGEIGRLAYIKELMKKWKK